MREIKRFDFTKIAEDLGYCPPARPELPIPPPSPSGQAGPNVPGGPGKTAGGGNRLQEMWPDSRALELLHYFDDKVAPGQEIEFEGHPICWAMIALLHKLTANPCFLYMPPFGKSLPLQPLKRTAQPKDNPLMKFAITEQGDDVRIVVTLLQDGNPNPFQMPFDEIEIQDIPPGKNLWLELDGRHYLFLFPIAKTFGQNCSTIYYKEGGKKWYCVVSNTPDAQVGDTPELSPFA